MSPFKRVLKFAKPYRKYFYLNIFFNILYSLLSVVSLYSMMPLLKVLLDPALKQQIQNTKPPVYNGELGGYFGYLKDTAYHQIFKLMQDVGENTALVYMCLLVVIAFFLRNISRYLAAYFFTALRTGTSKEVRQALYNKVLDLPVAYFTDQRKGDLMARISGDVSSIENSVLMPLVELVRAPFMLIITLAGLMFMSFQLTLFALVVLPIIAIFISLISKSLKKDARKAQDELGKILSYTEETLSASKIIKIFNAEQALNKRFSATLSYWRQLATRVTRKADLSSPVSEFLGSFAMIALVWYGASLILAGQGNLDGTTFLVFIGLFFQIIEPAKTMSKSIAEISRGNASSERILEVLDSEITVKQANNPIRINQFNQAITFKNASFAYNNNQVVIHDFNLTINKGSTIALVGQSGSGKSTIANLLARFYDLSSGEILIDGNNIEDLHLADYRKQIGMVTQESILFNDTVFNNIALSQPNASLEDVMAAAKIANAHEFIAKFPNQYQEGIGEAGGKLSGGQKQRLAIARAVLKNPPIMILDEATSALDTNSERLVQLALEQMMENRTSLVIAHRLSTIQKADLILVMDNGKVIEQGKHHELLAQNGVYRKLIEMQNFG